MYRMYFCFRNFRHTIVEVYPQKKIILNIEGQNQSIRININMHKFPIKFISIYLIIFFIIVSVSASVTFKITSYNVENLFDLEHNGTEYKEYIPNSKSNWTLKTANIKYINIGKVLTDIDADIVALQEVESLKSLLNLRKVLKSSNTYYPYYAIASQQNSTVKCAFLSKFPIINKEEIIIEGTAARSILKIKLKINNNNLFIFNNHWKSKSGPESLRIKYAEALKKGINKLTKESDYILLGDFNANYNEYITFLKSKKLNNTQGVTGINHILGTLNGSELIGESLVFDPQNSNNLYNLWLELTPYKRWSYNFFGKKGSPDNIIVSKGLYNKEGISYIDNSFNKFQENYLFNNRAIYRWQTTRNRNGKHLGFGFSDHLPIYAYFTTLPFKFDSKPTILNVDTSLKKKYMKKISKKIIDLNLANKEQLMLIKGIGAVLADRIIAQRPYKTIKKLLNVKGIGKKKLNLISPYFEINMKK